MKAALFDLDGVIIDTEPQYTHFWSKMGKIYFPEDKNFAINLKGQSLHCIFETYFHNDLDKQEEVKSYLKDFEKQMSYPYIDGAIDFVKYLRTCGRKTAIVTSSNQEKMAQLYKVAPELFHHFDHIFTAEDVKNSKPAPDCYLAAMNYFQLPADDCVVFEDSLNGLLAGRASGAFVVGVATSLPMKTLKQHCDFAIEGFTPNHSLLVETIENLRN